MSRKAGPVVTVGRLGIGEPVFRSVPPTQRPTRDDPVMEWRVVPIYIDGMEIIALSLDDAARFANALAHEAREP